MKGALLTLAVAALVVVAPLVVSPTRADVVEILRERSRGTFVARADDTASRLLDGLFGHCASGYANFLVFPSERRGADGRALRLKKEPVFWGYAAIAGGRLVAIRSSRAGDEVFILDTDARTRFRAQWFGDVDVTLQPRRSLLEIQEHFGHFLLYAIDDDAFVPLLARLQKLPQLIERWSFKEEEVARVARRSPEEWEKLLDSNDRTEVLEALAWLGGRFPREDLAAPLRKRESVKAKLEALSKSPDEWIAESARLARARDE